MLCNSLAPSHSACQQLTAALLT